MTSLPATRPLHVWHLITGLAPGGTEFMLHRLLATMDRGAVRSTVASLTAGGSVADQIRGLGTPLHTLGMRPGAPDPRGMLRLLRLMRADPPDVLQTWLYHADLLGLVGARLARVPHLVWNIRCSEMDARYERGMGGLILRTLARFSGSPDAVVVNSEAGRTLHRDRGYHPRRWEMMPNGFDLSRFVPDPDAGARLRAEIGAGAGEPLVGLIARYDPVKGHALFFAAAERLLAGIPDARFVLAGTGVRLDNPAFAGLIPPAVAGRVHLLGERRDVPYVTAALDVATCASTGEGFPNVIGEAMASGIPVVTTDVGDARAIVADCGIVVPPQDAAALTRAWAEVLRRPVAERRALGQRARARIAQHYDIHVIADRYVALYRELAMRPPA